jgi:hypothetical protein
MALITPSIFFTSIKGSVGGTTFSTNRAGLTAKTRLVGKRLPNTKQASALNESVATTVAWNALTSSQKNEFNAYALANTYTSRYGVTKPLTGFQWYKQLSQASFYFSGSQLIAPPAYSIPTALPTFTVELNSTSIIVTWSTAVDTSLVYIYVYGSSPIRGNARFQRGLYKLLDTRSLDLSLSFDITEAWNLATGLDYASLTSSSKFNLNILAFAISKTSFNSGIAQSAVGSIDTTGVGIGFGTIGGTFVIG